MLNGHQIGNGKEMIYLVNKGRITSYRIIVKHRGEFSEAYIEELERCIWEFVSDIPRNFISIKKINIGKHNGKPKK